MSMSPHTTHKNMVAVFGDNKFAALADEQDVMDAYEQVQRLKQLAEDRIWQAKAVPSIFIVEDNDENSGEWTVVRGKRCSRPGWQVYEVVREDDTEYVEDVEDTYVKDTYVKDTYKSVTGSFTCDCSVCNSDNDILDDLYDSDDDWWWFPYNRRDRINAIDDPYDDLEDPYDYNPYYYQYTDLKRIPCETCKYYYGGKCPNCEYLEQDYIPLVDPEDLEDEYFESYFDDDDEDYFDDPDDFVLDSTSRKMQYSRREAKKVDNRDNRWGRYCDKDKVDLRANVHPLHNMKSGRKWFVDKDYNIIRNKIWESRPKYWRRMRATRQSFRERVEDEDIAVMDTEDTERGYGIVYDDYDYSDYSDYGCTCSYCCGYEDDYFDDDWW